VTASAKRPRIRPAALVAALQPWAEVAEAQHRRLMDFADPEEAAEILWVGAGAARAAIWWATRRTGHMSAIDPDAGSIAWAERAARSAGLGARVTRLARSEVFIPVDTEAIREEDVRLGRQWAGEHKFDAIVSTDGDADRPLIADERGQWLRGDIVGVLCAHYLGIDCVVTPVSSNTAVEASGWFDRVYRTRIGSPYVIEQMNQALVRGGSVAGYEANGGFLLATDIHRDEYSLTALPTRDAVLPILAVLVGAREQGVSLSALIDALPARYTASDRLKGRVSD